MGKTVLFVGAGAHELCKQLSLCDCPHTAVPATNEAEIGEAYAQQEIDLVVLRDPELVDQLPAGGIPHTTFRPAFSWSKGRYLQDPPGWGFAKSIMLDKISRELANLGDRHVLILDDEPAIRGALRSMFSKFGFAVHAKEARTGSLETFSSYDVDLLLLDVNMPGLSWQDYTLKVRDRSPGTKIFLATGDRTVQPNENISGVLYKPFGITEVSQIAHQAVLSS